MHTWQVCAWLCHHGMAEKVADACALNQVVGADLLRIKTWQDMAADLVQRHVFVWRYFFTNWLVSRSSPPCRRSCSTGVPTRLRPKLTWSVTQVV